MGLGKFMLIVLVILAAVYYISPELFDDGKGWLLGKAQTGINSLNNTINYTSQNITYDLNVSENITETNTTSINNDTTVETVQETESFVGPATQAQICSWDRFGYPDYVGTDKEGDYCSDVVVDQDYECIANPPRNYEGVVNVLYKISTPEMRCCLTDGTCRWN